MGGVADVMATRWLVLSSLFFLLSAKCASAEWTIADVPACGLSCLLQTLPPSGCSLLDTACQCASQSLAQQTAACMQVNCTMADSLQLARVQAAQCHLPNPSKANETLVLLAVVFAVAVTAVILRVASTTFFKTFYIEDGLILTAVAVAILPFTCTILMTDLGYGHHLWGLENGRLTRILKLFYIAENAYIVVLALTKISLVLFYLRIFPYESFRIPALITLVFLIISSTVILILTILSCRPIALFWNKDIKHGKCLDINALAYANAGLAIVQDLIILALPISILPRLTMQLRKKISVGIMFALGSFGCITSMIRLRSLLVFGNSIDPTWDYVPVVWWTVLELGSGIVCACLPAIRKLLARFFPLVFRTTEKVYNTPPVGLGALSKDSKQSEHNGSVRALISDDIPVHGGADARGITYDATPAPPVPLKHEIMMRNSVIVTHEAAPTPPPKDQERPSWANWTADDGESAVSHNHTFLRDPSSSSNSSCGVSVRSVEITSVFRP